MWEQALIESKENSSNGQKWWIFPLSAIAHVAIVITIVVVTYWHVEAVETPHTRMNVPYSPQNPIPASLGNRVDRAVKSEKKQQDQKSPVIMPEQTHQESSQEKPEYGPAENLKDGEQGVPWGVEGGDPTITSLGPASIQESEDLPVVMTPETQQPVLIQRVEPVYPHTAIRNRIFGIVILEAVITKSGTVEELKIIRGDHKILEIAAIDAVKKWKYRPATLNGRPIKVYFTVTIHFSLK